MPRSSRRTVREDRPQIDRSVKAWAARRPGKASRVIDATPGSDVGAMLIMDGAARLGRGQATGQDYACDEAVAAAVLATVEQQAELFLSTGLGGRHRGTAARPSPRCACRAATQRGSPKAKS